MQMDKQMEMVKELVHKGKYLSVIPRIRKQSFHSMIQKKWKSDKNASITFQFDPSQKF